MILTYRTRPYPHQQRALKMLLRNRGGGLQVPMRWGKSWVGVNFAGALYHLEDVRRVLVITVTSGLGVWENQISTHCPVSSASNIWGSSKWELNKLAEKDYLAFMVVNFQNLYTREYEKGSREWIPVKNMELAKWDADIVIVDESHHIGDPSAIQSQEAYKLGRNARFRVFMTGSMFHRKPFFVFGQARFHDNGAALGDSYDQYKKRVAVFGGFGDYEVLRYRNLRWMTRRLKPTVFMEEYVPPRNAVRNVIDFDLTGRNLQFYSDMSRKSVILHRGKRSMADIVLTRHLRLQMLCGGFVRWDDGTCSMVGSDKLNMCSDRLTEYREQDIEKAVIGCRFIPELVAVCKLAKRLGFLPVPFHGGVPKGDERTRRVALFQETSKPCLFVSQIAAGKESIDLSAASVMMFFSLSESYVDHDQFSKRIEKYEEKRTLMYDFMQGRGTRDVVTLAALDMKKDVADLIVSDPELVEQIATLENRKRVAA